MENKMYCEDCNCGHECIKCKKPKAAHLYEEDGRTCKACAHRKGVSAFNGTVSKTSIPFSTKTDMLRAFKEAEDEIVDRIKTKTEKDRGVKYYLNVNIGLIKPTNDITTQAGFSTNMNIALQGGEIDIGQTFNEIFVKLEDFCRDGSGGFSLMLLALF